MNLKGARTQGRPHHDEFVMLADAFEQKVEAKLMEEQEALEAKACITARIAEIVAKLPVDEVLADLAVLPPDSAV